MTPRLLAGCAIAMATLAGCRTAPPGPGPAPSHATVEGRATFYEKLMMPPDSVLAVELVDLDGGGSPIARAEFPSLPGPPYAFDLRYEPADAPAGHRLGVVATLRTPRGERMFSTPEPVPVVDGRTRPEEFRMVRTP